METFCCESKVCTIYKKHQWLCNNTRLAWFAFKTYLEVGDYRICSRRKQCGPDSRPEPFRARRPSIQACEFHTKFQSRHPTFISNHNTCWRYKEYNICNRVLYLIQLAIETPKTTGALFTLLRCELNERAILWPSGRIHVAVASLPSTGYVVQTMTKTGPVRRRSRFFISTRVAANHLLQFKMRHLLY